MQRGACWEGFIIAPDPPCCWQWQEMWGGGGGWGGEEPHYPVRDLFAPNFHSLCPNFPFSSDQGARQPLAAWLASCQTIVQKLFSQSGLPGQTEVRRGTERLEYAKDIKKQRRVTNTKLLTVQHSGRGQYAGC